MPQILFLGFFIQINQLPSWLQWVQYLVATKYGLNLALLTEFDPTLCLPQNCPAWANILVFNDVKGDLIGVYIGILMALFVGFRFLALVVLHIKALSYET